MQHLKQNQHAKTHDGSRDVASALFTDGPSTACIFQWNVTPQTADRQQYRLVTDWSMRAVGTNG